MIILEGPDLSSKSTVVKWIKENTEIEVVKPYYPKVNQLAYYLHSPPHYEGYFLERYYLSEIVYPRFKKNREVMESWKQFLIEAALLPYGPVILYFRPDRETIIENFKTRGDTYINESEIDAMLSIYDWAIERSHIPYIRYDFKKDDINEKINEVVILQMEKSMESRKFKSFLSSGDPTKKEGLMFIGEDPSNKSIGEGYIRAFISDKRSSTFFHQILDEAGVYKKEMPYFTNWNKGLDNDKDKRETLKYEIKELKPRKIICLGKEVAKKTRIGEIIEHPAYVKRFHSKDYQFYVDKIKELMKI